MPLIPPCQLNSSTSHVPEDVISNCDSEVIFDTSLADGTYSVDVVFEGGTGKAKILSPAELVVKGGEAVVTVTWSSKNYDYMIVDGVKYMNLTPGKSSSFSFPIKQLGKTMDVIGDSVAMSKPHEIEYKLTFTLSK